MRDTINTFASSVVSAIVIDKVVLKNGDCLYLIHFIYLIEKKQTEKKIVKDI